MPFSPRFEVLRRKSKHSGNLARFWDLSTWFNKVMRTAFVHDADTSHESRLLPLIHLLDFGEQRKQNMLSQWIVFCHIRVCHRSLTPVRQHSNVRIEKLVWRSELESSRAVLRSSGENWIEIRQLRRLWGSERKWIALLDLASSGSWTMDCTVSYGNIDPTRFHALEVALDYMDSGQQAVGSWSMRLVAFQSTWIVFLSRM